MSGALTWGMSLEDIKQQLDSNASVYGNNLLIHNMNLTNFNGDCGAIYLTNANTATKEKLKTVEKYASLSGFSKIFATVVGKPEYLERALYAFRSNKWKCVAKGKSNRNETKDDYVFVKYIRNCKYKGY